MAKYTIEDTTLTAVADKMRDILQETEPITPEEMPEKLDIVRYVGTKDERNRFWDVFQLNGTRRNYPYLFSGSGWTDDIFPPHHAIIVTSLAIHLFAYNSQITKIETPITIDTALDSSGLFMACSRLVSIFSLTITDKVSSYTNWFKGCTSLQLINLNPESVIAGNGFSVSDSPELSRGSLLRILNALQDKTGSTSTWTVTLGEANLAKLSEEEIGIAEGKGWVLA